MDTPENCGGASGMGSVATQPDQLDFQNLNTDPATFCVAVSGSATKATSVTLGQSGGPTAQVVMGIYAPSRPSTLANSVDFIGAVVAQQVQMSNSVKVTYDPKIQTIAEDALLVYRTPTTSSAPTWPPPPRRPTPAAELPMRPGNSSRTAPGSSSALLRRAKSELRQ